MGKTIKEYVDSQDPSKKKIINKLRRLLKKTLPNIKESMGYGVLCYEDLYYIAALPRHQVNFGFSIIGLSKEEVKLFEGTGKTMRHVKVHSLDFDEKELIKRIKLVKRKAKPVHQ